MTLNNAEFAEEFKKFTKHFALEVIRFCQYLPKTEESVILKRQLLRAATSTAANYRAACRARSGREFYSKISIVLEEADESLFWLELLEDAEIAKDDHCQPLKEKALKIIKIIARARKSSANANQQSKTL